MNNRNKFKISLFGVSLLLGAMLTIQITSGKNQETNFKADLITVKSSLAYEIKHREQLLDEIRTIENKISEYESSAGNQENVLEDMRRNLEKAKIEAGFTQLEGHGIRVEIRDAPGFSAIVPNRKAPHQADYHISDLELQYLINILESNGANAVAFNGQRIVTTSAIREVGYSQYNDEKGITMAQPGVMQVNFTPVSMPYVIEAVGDIDKMKGALSTYFGKDYFTYKGTDLTVREFRTDKLTLLPYTGSTTVKVATEDTEGVAKP